MAIEKTKTISMNNSTQKGNMKQLFVFVLNLLRKVLTKH